jgi:hypothetical protein
MGAAAPFGPEDRVLTATNYYKGMAVFKIVKGGAMVQATVGGQKFKYKPVGAS